MRSLVRRSPQLELGAGGRYFGCPANPIVPTVGAAGAEAGGGWT